MNILHFFAPPPLKFFPSFSPVCGHTICEHIGGTFGPFGRIKGGGDKISNIHHYVVNKIHYILRLKCNKLAAYYERLFFVFNTSVTTVTSTNVRHSSDEGEERECIESPFYTNTDTL